jgi:hypothetical protein
MKVKTINVGGFVCVKVIFGVFFQGDEYVVWTCDW